MKLTCVQENLSKALSVVNRAVATRSSLPVLSNVLVATDSSMLKLAATNMEISTTVVVGCKIESEGAVTVPARLLTDLVSQFEAGPVELELNSETLELALSSGKYRATVKGISADDFPPLPTAEPGTALRIDPAKLKQMVDLTTIAAATDDSRPVLAGVSIAIGPDSLVFAAADGYRLAVKTLETQTDISGASTKVQIIVPRNSMLELSRILGEAEEEVEIIISPQATHAVFNVGSVQMISHLIEGQFPNYEQLVPTDFQTRLVMSTAEFSKATRIASIFARGGSNVIRFEADPAGNSSGSVSVSAESADVGKNSGDLDATIEGEQAFIAFNARFLGECLGTIDTEEVEVQLSGATSPGLIRPLGDESYTHVIMPMHTVR